MSTYFPGRGLKKPMNDIEVPTYPDIRKGPPRFVWSRKHWTVDTGRTMAEVEKIPQLQEAAVLYQSYDYNSQHAYGKMPSYTAVVNKEFRPPLIERDDLLPLSRIPRPVIVPRINPGGAHPSGNNVFADQNINLPGVEKFLTNRVKEGQMRPTMFAPLFGEGTTDTQVLPDLEVKLPPTSAGAGFKYPTVADASWHEASGQIPEVQTREVRYDRYHPELDSGVTPITFDALDPRRDMQLDYTNPQVSATSGRVISSAIPIYDAVRDHSQIDLDYVNPQVSAFSGRATIPGTSGLSGLSDQDQWNPELEYTRPQVSAHSGRTSVAGGIENFSNLGDINLSYNRPQISSHSGTTTLRGGDGLTPIDFDLEAKPGTGAEVRSGANMSGISMWDHEGSRRTINETKVYDVRPDRSFIVPNNTSYKAQNELESAEPHFRQKVESLGKYQPNIHQTYIPRAGISTPQIKMREKKGRN